MKRTKQPKTPADLNLIIAKAMSEKELQENVRQLAISLGYRYYHTHRSDHSPSGFPDLVMVRVNDNGGRLLFVELKREGKYPTREQTAWLNDFNDLDQEAYCWKPSDWLSGEIERVLR